MYKVRARAYAKKKTSRTSCECGLEEKRVSPEKITGLGLQDIVPVRVENVE